MVIGGLAVSSCFKWNRYCIYCSKLPELGFNAINVFLLVNTCHALGFNAFLMVDVLTFFRCHLRAIEMRLNAMFSNCWNIKCSVFVLTQIGVF